MLEKYEYQHIGRSIIDFFFFLLKKNNNDLKIINVNNILFKMDNE